MMPARPPDRRLAPRPLPLHLASAGLLWLTSHAGLTSLPSGWPSSSEVDGEAQAQLRALAGEVARLGADRVDAALRREVRRRAAAFLSGVSAYRGHPYRRPAGRRRVLWRGGAARLLDYGAGRGGPVVFLVPSLINRHYILDLLPERSFARHLAAAGLRPVVLDWGQPGAAERGFGLDDYIAGPLAAALSAAVAASGGPVALVGYCMGGLLALAAALRRPRDIASIALLATPWDFHAERPDQARLLASAAELLPRLAGGAAAPLPVAAIQALFAALDPFLAERKFVRFAGLDPAGAAARAFVALEDWLNDGVPLARGVALECARSWYRDNDPGRGRWRVDGRRVRPERLDKPALIVLPSRDRIVPPASAEPLAAAIAGAQVLRPPFGHVGMMASEAAPDAVWRPIARWLKPLPA